jgi:hypothetical protein
MVFPDECEPNIGQKIRSRVILDNSLQAHATNTPQEGGPISERRLLSARRLLLEQGTVLSSQVNLINDGMDQYKKAIPQGEK